MSEDGWLSPLHIGTFDGDGFLYFRGPHKGMIL